MNVYYLRKCGFVVIATCFTLLAVMFFSWIRISEKKLHRLPEYHYDVNPCPPTTLNSIDRARLTEIFKEIFLIDLNLSKLITEEANTEFVDYYIQENYPALSELQEEFMKICANINTPFSIGIIESPFISCSCDSLPNMKFTVNEGVKEKIAEFSEEAKAHCVNLLLFVKPLFVANLRLFLLQGKYEETRRVLELSSQILDCIEDSTILSLMIKLIFVENIVSVYELHKTLLPLDHVESCNLYTKKLLHCVRDEIFKCAIILKYNISALILYCRATSSDYKVAQLLTIERFLVNLVVSNSGFNMLIDGNDEIRLPDISAAVFRDESDIITDVLISETQILVSMINIP